MSYALYSANDQIGSLSTISGYGAMLRAIQQCNAHCGGKPEIPNLTELFMSGKSNEPDKIAEDISKILASGTSLHKGQVNMFQNLRNMCRAAHGKPVFIGES